MKAEIINVGTEILLGGIVNLNSRYLSEELASLGIGVYYQTSVGDNPVRLKKVLATAVSRSEVIVITGGLGPTPDDITKETVAAALNIPLVEDEISLRRIVKYFEAAGKEMPEANRKQALCPQGATIFKNDVGTAPGYALNAGKQYILMLPGPPAELETMFENYVKPYLEKLSDGVISSQNIRIFGLGESQVAEMVAPVLESVNPTVAPYAKEGEVELRVTARAATPMAAFKVTNEMVKNICKILGDNVYTVKYSSLQETVVEKLKEANIGISTAESCTAGLLSSKITEIAGSSQVFKFGITAYANEIKQEFLGVKAETLQEYGAVSRQTSLEMAMGAREKGATKLGVGITGIAGPETSESKPVGLVYITLCDDKYFWCNELCLTHKSNDRDAIRNIAAKTALDMVRRYLDVYPKRPAQMVVLPQSPEIVEEKEEAKVVERIVHTNILNDDVFNSVALFDEDNTADADVALNVPQYDETFGFVGAQEEEPEQEDAAKKRGFFARLFSKKAAETADEIEPEITEEEPETAEQETDTVEEPEMVAETESVEEAAEESETEEPIAEETESEEEIEYEDIFSSTGNVQEDEDIEEEFESESETDEEQNLDQDTVLLTDEEEEEIAPKEKNFFIRFFKSIIPWKGDKASELIRKFVFLVSFAVFIGSATYIIDYFTDQNRNATLIDNIREQWENVNTDSSVNEGGIYSKFEFLLEQNSDTIGWLKIPNTNIDNPVFYNEDITYYETHNMAGEESRYGALFVHPDCFIGVEDVDQNITIYGHNTKDGSMFADLLKYSKLAYYRQHPVIQFDTIYRQGQYKIFAVITTNAFPEQDDGYVYPYMKDTFYSHSDFNDWVTEAKRRSIINTEVDVVPGDEILTLSTCSYFFEESRTIVMARRVRDGEMGVDVSKSSLNENVLYPQAWYDKFGGEKPVFSSSETMSTTTSSDVTSSGDTSSDTPTSSTVTSRPSTSSRPSSSRPASSSKPSSSSKVSTSSKKPASSSQVTTTSSKPASSSQVTTTSSKPVSSSQVTTTSSEPASSSQVTTTSSKPASSSQVTTTSSEPVSGSEPAESSSTVSTSSEITESEPEEEAVESSSEPETSDEAEDGEDAGEENEE